MATETLGLLSCCCETGWGDHLFQFLSSSLIACVSSRPGQCGRCDGYLLEGKELEFYLKKLKMKKTK